MSVSLITKFFSQDMGKGMFQKITLLTLATMVNSHTEEGMNNIDMTTLVRKGSDVDKSPRLYKVIEKDKDGKFSMELGWSMMKGDNRLLNDLRFRGQFLFNTDIVRGFNEGKIVIVEGIVSSMYNKPNQSSVYRIGKSYPLALWA